MTWPVRFGDVVILYPGYIDRLEYRYDPALEFIRSGFDPGFDQFPSSDLAMDNLIKAELLARGLSDLPLMKRSNAKPDIFLIVGLRLLLSVEIRKRPPLFLSSAVHRRLDTGS
jgi:hypothetical protein